MDLFPNNTDFNNNTIIDDDYQGINGVYLFVIIGCCFCFCIWSGKKNYIRIRRHNVIVRGYGSNTENNNTESDNRESDNRGSENNNGNFSKYVKTMKNYDKINNCCICLAKLNNEIVIELYENENNEWENDCRKKVICIKKCNHKFHEECLLPWLEENKNCPLCRCEL
jgi:hypothetical protein